MKTLILLTLLVLALLSCKKQSEELSYARLSYKLNGQLIAYENTSADDQAIGSGKLDPVNFGESAYEIGAHKGGHDDLQMLLYTDSLKTINYHYDSVAARVHALIIAVDHNSPEVIASRVVFADDYLDVTITSYANGRISGNFSARLSPYTISSNSYEYTNKGSIVITEGQFSNIEVSY